MIQQRSRGAHTVDPQYLVPSLVVAAVVPRLIGQRTFADAAFRVALGYTAADLLGGGVRTIVARHRPDSTGNAWRFRPFRPRGEWGSMPSAHTTHAFAIAAGIAEASGRPRVAGVASGAGARDMPFSPAAGTRRVNSSASAWRCDPAASREAATLDAGVG